MAGNQRMTTGNQREDDRFEGDDAEFVDLVGAEHREKNDEDPLVLHNSDHPDMVLVTAPLTGNNDLAITKVKQSLDQAFTIKDLGFARYFLGIEILRAADGTSLNQRKYALDLVTDAGLSGSKPVPTPFPKVQAEFY